MRRDRRARRVKVSGDGTGVVSRAGAGLLRELAVHDPAAMSWRPTTPAARASSHISTIRGHTARIVRPERQDAL